MLSEERESRSYLDIQNEAERTTRLTPIDWRSRLVQEAERRGLIVYCEECQGKLVISCARVNNFANEHWEGPKQVDEYFRICGDLIGCNVPMGIEENYRDEPRTLCSECALKNK